MAYIDDQLYCNKYRIQSARWSGCDYSAPGRYFITICTKHREPWFSTQCRHGFVCVTKVGGMVHEELMATQRIRLNVLIDRWVIMPDHVHVIIIIEQPIFNITNTVETFQQFSSNTVETFRRNVSTKTATTIPLCRQRPNSLGSIVNQWKMMCTKRIRQTQPTFTWQPRFYDHIIRDDQAYAAICGYMRQNPWQWEQKNNHASL